MTDIAALKVANAARWAAMKLDATRVHEFDAVATRLCDPDAKAMYLAIEAATSVPWFVVAVIHERESGQKWDTHLGQGDPISQKTVNDPAGRGPFFDPNAFYRGALDALIDCPPHASKWTDWTVGGSLTLLLSYNGFGYGERPSPYLFAGTNQYASGKFIRDHVYDPSAVDVQDGCAPILSRMTLRDPSIKFTTAPGPWVSSVPPAVVPTPPHHIVSTNFVRAIRNWI